MENRRREVSDKNNTGIENSGHWNSGHRNSGHRNSGDWNSGHWNSGHRNSGHRNSGHYNSGHRNSGDYNSGDYNSGDYNSGFFNTNEPTVRMFNQDTGLYRRDIDIPFIDLPITEWIPESEMTDEQKKEDPDFHVKQGTLINRDYKEAWRIAWDNMDVETRNKFLNLPNFNADIFKEITGIDVMSRTPITCNGKVVEIDGKKYRLTEVEE